MIRFALCILTSLAFVALAADREASGADKSSSVVIGLALPAQPTNDLFMEGAELAARQINAAGGIAGRPVVLVSERAPVVDARDLLRRAAGDRHVALKLASQQPVAVIGHYSWDGAVAASQIYQLRKVLYFSTFMTSDILTRRKFDLVFDMHRRIRVTSQAFADYLPIRGRCRVFTLFEQSDFGSESVLFFSQHAGRLGVNVSLSLSFPSDANDFQDLLLFLLATKATPILENDAIVFFGQPAQVRTFVANARKLGFAMPIVVPWATYGPQGRLVTSEAKGSVAVRALLHEDSDSDAMTSFRDAFRTAYGRPPTEFSALAFDAVRLVAMAMQQTGTANPTVLARHLRTLVHIGPFQGATGPIAFNLEGERIDRPLRIDEYMDGNAVGNVTIADAGGGDRSSGKCGAP